MAWLGAVCQRDLQSKSHQAWGGRVSAEKVRDGRHCKGGVSLCMKPSSLPAAHSCSDASSAQLPVELAASLGPVLQQWGLLRCWSSLTRSARGEMKNTSVLLLSQKAKGRSKCWDLVMSSREWAVQLPGTLDQAQEPKLFIFFLCMILGYKSSVSAFFTPLCRKPEPSSSFTTPQICPKAI